jgi:hypothetical protein
LGKAQEMGDSKVFGVFLNKNSKGKRMKVCDRMLSFTKFILSFSKL